jgi:hypothetical protein
MLNVGNWTDRERWTRLIGRNQRRQRHDVWWRLGLTGAASAIGAGLMYLFDPQAGRRRRHMAYDRSAAAVRHSARRVGRWSRGMAADAVGLVQRVRHLRPSQAPAANDEALADRVRSTILRAASVPHGRININVQHGVVVLRGQLERLDQIRSLTEAAKRVPGVREVVSYLHLPQTPAPNKQEALATKQDVVISTAPADGTAGAERQASS